AKEIVLPQVRASLIVLGLWLLSPFQADACSCGTCETVSDARDGYGVFLHLAKAEILASYPLLDGGSYDESKNQFIPIRQLVVKPTKSFRGPEPDWLLIHDEQCGLPGEVGDEILIAVHQKADGNLYSSACAVKCARNLNWLRHE
ncbi:MAG: hypothetical protein AAGJ51_10445, partial [Pseudomonadota bacterium]